jgi:hypothetical protein
MNRLAVLLACCLCCSAVSEASAPRGTARPDARVGAPDSRGGWKIVLADDDEEGYRVLQKFLKSLEKYDPYFPPAQPVSAEKK